MNIWRKQKRVEQVGKISSTGAPAIALPSSSLNIRAINPLLSKTNSASIFLDELDSAAILAYNILRSDEELAKRSRDFAYIAWLKNIANSAKNPDAIMEELYSAVRQIGQYDEKLEAILADYIKNKKSIHDTLAYIYQNITPQGLRVLYANIEVLIEKVGEIKERDVKKPVLDRLELLKRIFEQVRAFEDRELVDEQKRRLWGLILRIKNGISDGSWNGFLGKYGIASDTEWWITKFSKYNNSELVEVLKRKKEKYGESNPQEWLGNERTPYTLVYVYHNLDAIISQRLNALWQNAWRIALSLKAVIEALFGKNPSTALNRVKKRLELLEKRINELWKGKRSKSLELLIAARIESEKLLKFIVSVQESYKLFFGQKALHLSNSYKSERVLAKNTESLTARKKPDFAALSYLLLTSRLFEDNVSTEVEVAESLGNPAPIDGKNISDFDELFSSALNAYKKFLDFIDTLELGIQTLQIREKINAIKGDANG